MKTTSRTQSRFATTSLKSTDEIKAACRQKTHEKTYDVRQNGDHIWIEVPQQQKQYWSPMLHVKLQKREQLTWIEATVGENPMLWLTFLGVKLASVGIFILSGVVAWLKSQLAQNYNTQLFVMFGMVTVWFALYLLGERYKRKGARQVEALRGFVEAIA